MSTTKEAPAADKAEETPDYRALYDEGKVSHLHLSEDKKKVTIVGSADHPFAIGYPFLDKAGKTVGWPKTVSGTENVVVNEGEDDEQISTVTVFKPSSLAPFPYRFRFLFRDRTKHVSIFALESK